MILHTMSLRGLVALSRYALPCLYSRRFSDNLIDGLGCVVDVLGI